MKLYLAVLWICDIVFNADTGNGFRNSQKKECINKGDFKEIVKEDKYVRKLPSGLTSGFVLS